MVSPMPCVAETTFEYCCFTYVWKSQGWTQEIERLYQKNQEMLDWKGRYWIDFVNQMVKQGWEVETILPLGDRTCLERGAVAYFKRNRFLSTDAGAPDRMNSKS